MSDQEPSPQKSPMVAIVGRPNVGKSSLFNCILGRRLAIVHEQSGVTRDRIAAPVACEGRHFLLVDTGGLGVFLNEEKVETFDGLIRAQVEGIVKEADVVIWMVDAKDGLSPLDHEVATLLRRISGLVILVANKADNAATQSAARAEFTALGLGEALPISCSHRRGLVELLERVSAGLPECEVDEDADKGFRLAIVGRPNVGKSSLVNRLLGEDRVIVSDIPGTTRDAVDIPIEVLTEEERVPMTLIDTAGMRRKRQVDTAVELFSMMRAEHAIKRSDAVILVLDANAPATAQDRRIAHLISNGRKPCLIVANKWDLACQDIKLKDLKLELRRKMSFMDFAPIVGSSALSGYNLREIVSKLLEIREQLEVMVPTAVLNQFLQDAIARTPPPSVKGKFLKVLYGTMVANRPPHFILFVNQKQLCPAHYLQFLQNRLRDAFFPEAGLPIWLELRSRRQTDKPGDATRQAAAANARTKLEKRNASDRHHARRKGWRKRK